MLSPMYAWGLALALSLVKADSPTANTATTPLGSLYAYGSGISGLPTISSDGEYRCNERCLARSAVLIIPSGVAVLGWGQPAVATIATNLTCKPQREPFYFQFEADRARSHPRELFPGCRAQQYCCSVKLDDAPSLHRDSAWSQVRRYVC